MMHKRVLRVVLLFGFGLSSLCLGQTCTATHTTDLYCLLPATFHTKAAPFSAFFTPFGTELAQLPTAKPAGLVLTFDHGQLVPANETLGAIFSERAETIGRHRLLVSFTYQYFGFSSIDGTDLRTIPIVLTYPATGPVQVYTVTTNRIDIKGNQYVALGVVGVTHNIDLSVAVPFERIAMSAAILNGSVEYNPSSGATVNIAEYVPGSSSGVGDVILGAKWKVFDDEKVRMAPGVDVRIPSGDEYNFLGSGTVGVKPYVAVSLKGRFAPHGNIGFQWNGQSILNPNAQGAKQTLPTDFFFTFGVNADINKRLTLIADLLNQHFFNAPRLTPPVPYTAISVPGIGTPLSVGYGPNDYTAYNGAVGFKARIFAHLILTGNATVKLDNGGLRARVIPLVGLSYSF